jgi:hypothetical protein
MSKTEVTVDTILAAAFATGRILSQRQAEQILERHHQLR